MADPIEIDVKVIIQDPDADPPKFKLECNDLPKGTKDNDFIFNNDGHPGFILNYILQGDAHGYRFPDDKDEALYSAKGVGCPRNKGQWPQFKARDVKSGNKILVVRNLNQSGHQGQFGYTLRVTKTPHDPDTPADQYLELDPGGENNNGSWGMSSVNYAAIALIGVGTGVVSALVTTIAMARFDLICPGGSPGL